VLGIVNTLQRQFSIDPDRLYIAGQSDGGYGVWNLVTLRPDVFAAAIVVCGGGNPGNAGRAARVPMWVFHGDQDDVAPVGETRQMVEAVKKAGGNPRYTEYAGSGHDIWNRAFADAELVDWLFAQRK
jgi:predicted peptidase